MSRKALLTVDGCGGCRDVKAALKPLLDDGSLTEIKATTEEGRKIGKALNLHQVPECVEIGDDGSYKVCSIEDLLDEVDEREEKKK